MKRILAIVFFPLCVSSVFAAERLSERIYLSTDRQVYVTGDRVFVSAFCFDASTRRLSDFSSVAYCELISSDGTAQKGRIALAGGRGAGMLTLHDNLPTGNYLLVAYTAVNRDERDYDYFQGARTITVINPSSGLRVKDGVEIVEDNEYVSQTGTDACGDVSMSLKSTPERSSTVPLLLANTGGTLADISLSVVCDDGIAEPATTPIAAFSAGIEPGREFTTANIPEYEGEIIRARVIGSHPEQVGKMAGMIAYVSSSGDRTDTYSATIQNDGTVEFYTNNIYGDKELVCQIGDIPEDYSCHLDVLSPFVLPRPASVPKLKLCSKLGPKIERRAVASQIVDRFDADTLFDLLPYRRNPLLGDEVISYVLDDYTRFPTMEEIIVEFIPELRTRKDSDEKRTIQVKLQNVYRTSYFASDEALVMVDGVPIFDHEKIMSYDPLLVKAVNIYPYIYHIGQKTVAGIVDFTTYKGNLPSMELADNVRVLDFEGTSYPLAYTCRGISENEEYPDFRHTLYWHPGLKLEAGSVTEVEISLPGYPGNFVAELEGFDSDGKPVHQEFRFEIR